MDELCLKSIYIKKWTNRKIVQYTKIKSNQSLVGKAHKNLCFVGCLFHLWRRKMLLIMAVLTMPKTKKVLVLYCMIQGKFYLVNLFEINYKVIFISLRMIHVAMELLFQVNCVVLVIFMQETKLVLKSILDKIKFQLLFVIIQYKRVRLFLQFIRKLIILHCTWITWPNFINKIQLITMIIKLWNLVNS